MQELFLNAWAGWGAYIKYGKLAALFLVALLWLWFHKKGGVRKSFVLYATVLGGLCICPLTAVLLMCYQTRFYDYEWIWSAVPVTALIAYGVVCFLSEVWEKASREKNKLAFGAVTALILAAIVLCGGLGSGKWRSDDQKGERQQAVDTLAELRSILGEKEICLWAPEEVLEYVRETDNGVKLLYGRNMWDASLNAYAYDVYEPWMKRAYIWLEKKEEQFRGQEIGGQELSPGEYTRLAKEAGVNCVLLPKDLRHEIVWEVANVYGAQPYDMEEYWLIYE